MLQRKKLILETFVDRDKYKGTCYRASNWHNQRSEQTFHVNVVYIKGLLSNLKRKSVEPIALEYIENLRGPRNLQFFMKDAKWDDERATRIY